MPSATRVPEAVREPEQYAVAVNVTGLPAGTPPDVSGGMMSGGGAGRIRPVQPVVITSNAAARNRRYCRLRADCCWRLRIVRRRVLCTTPRVDQNLCRGSSAFTAGPADRFAGALATRAAGGHAPDNGSTNTSVKR